MPVLYLVVILSILSCGEAEDKKSQSNSNASSEQADGDQITTDLTYYNFAKAELDTHCAWCHTNPPSRGAPPLFRLDEVESKNSYPGARSVAVKAIETLQDRSMPPAPYNAALSDDVRNKLIEWFQAGAPAGEGSSSASSVDGTLDPVVSVLRPIAAGETPTADVYRVQVSFLNATSQSGWNIYTTTNPEQTNGGTAIATGLDLATNTYDWDTSSVANGTYYIYATVLTPGGIVRGVSAGTVTITNP